MKLNYSIYCFIILILVNSCGYERVYLSKELNYYITQLEFKSNQKINQSIKKTFNNLNKNVDGKKIKAVVNSQKEKKIITKDKKGNPSLFALSIKVEIYLYEDDNFLNSKTFIKENKYSNNENKFNLNIYEQNLEENLNQKIIEEIFRYLNQVKL
tara:strand:- start:68 stop:532 length:465 start_codon:yes stop_codon:yes gene_type:complete